MNLLRQSVAATRFAIAVASATTGGRRNEQTLLIVLVNVAITSTPLTGLTAVTGLAKATTATTSVFDTRVVARDRARRGSTRLRRRRRFCRCRCCRGAL